MNTCYLDLNMLKFVHVSGQPVKLVNSTKQA